MMEKNENLNDKNQKIEQQKPKQKEKESKLLSDIFEKEGHKEKNKFNKSNQQTLLFKIHIYRKMKEEVRVRLCRNVIIFRRIVYHLYDYIYNLSNNIYI